MTAIIDYGVGNLFSLLSSFAKIGEEAVVTADEKVLDDADRIVLPGVGAFGDAAEKLKNSGMAAALAKQKEKGKPILGICLGMQLLFDKSYEYGVYDGLGFIPGIVRPISDVVPDGFKIPHMGWNRLDYVGEKHPLFKYLGDEEYVYFVHSYYAADCEGYVTANAEYASPLTASVAKDNVMGCQFHPEKSGDTGLAILRAFCTMKEGAIC